MLREYFNYFLHLFNDGVSPIFIHFSWIAKGNFLGELKKMGRVKIGVVTATKKLLGDEGIEFSNRTEEVKDDIQIRIQAKKGESISGTIGDIFSKMEKLAGVRKEVHRIRVEGTGEDGRDAILDTDFIRRIDFVDADIHDETGVVNTGDFFLKLSPIIASFHDI